MANSRLLLVTFVALALAMMASASVSAQQQPGRKKKGARAKTRSFRLRRNPHLSRSHSRSLASSLAEDDEAAWGSEVSEARELNIFLRNAASLIFDDNLPVMSMSMPTTAPAVIRPAIGGITGNSENASAPVSVLPPTLSVGAKDNISAAETPEPIPLPTQPPVCAPLSSNPNSDDIALNISITYELTILATVGLSEVLEGLDTSFQDELASSLAGCETDNWRRLKGLNGNLFHHYGRGLAVTAVDSLGVVETPRPDNECHTIPNNSSNATCFVVDGGISIYFSPDTSEEAINAHEKDIAAVLEGFLDDPSLITTIPGVLRAEYIDMSGLFQSQALSEGPMEPNSTGTARLPIIGAVFLVAGTVFLGAILANRWKEKKSGDDLLRMQKLESYDSNTNDVTAADIPYPSPDSTILGFSTDDDQDDAQEDADDNYSIDTGAAAIRCVDVESFPKYNGDSVGDHSSVDFEAADGSGNVVSVPCGLTPHHVIEDKPRSISPYCYPSFQIWPKDEDSTL